MAYIRIDLISELVNGQSVTFKAPCDCTAIQGLRTYYLKDGEQKSATFTLKDSHGNDLTGIGNLFEAGTHVKAILNTENSAAYLLNADTNRYLEDKFAAIHNMFSFNPSTATLDITLNPEG